MAYISSRFSWLRVAILMICAVDQVFCFLYKYDFHLFFSDAINLSPLAKSQIYAERSKYLSALFYLITSKCGITVGAQKYGSLLMMASSVQVCL